MNRKALVGKEMGVLSDCCLLQVLGNCLFSIGSASVGFKLGASTQRKNLELLCNKQKPI